MKTFDTPSEFRAKIVKATPHKETHGKALIQAISLRMEWWPEYNSAVNLLHENLQDLIFWTPPEVQQQCALEGIPVVKEHKKHRRVPTLVMPLKLDGLAFSGYTLTIEHGIDDSSALELYLCALTKFEVDAKEGGSAPIRWSLNSNKTVTPELVGQLCGLEGSTVVYRLTPPLPGEAIDGTVGHPGAGKTDDAQADLLDDDEPDAATEFSRVHGNGPGGAFDGDDGDELDGDDDDGPADSDTAPAPRALSTEPAWPFPNHDRQPAGETAAPVVDPEDGHKPGTRTGRGRAKTKQALAEGQS